MSNTVEPTMNDFQAENRNKECSRFGCSGLATYHIWTQTIHKEHGPGWNVMRSCVNHIKETEKTYSTILTKMGHDIKRVPCIRMET